MVASEDLSASRAKSSVYFSPLLVRGSEELTRSHGTGMFLVREALGLYIMGVERKALSYGRLGIQATS